MTKISILELTEKLKGSKQKALKRHAEFGLPIVISEIIDGEKWIIEEYIDGRKVKIRKIIKKI